VALIAESMGISDAEEFQKVLAEHRQGFCLDRGPPLRDARRRHPSCRERRPGSIALTPRLISQLFVFAFDAGTRSNCGACEAIARVRRRASLTLRQCSWLGRCDRSARCRPTRLLRASRLETTWHRLPFFLRDPQRMAIATPLGGFMSSSRLFPLTLSLASLALITQGMAVTVGCGDGSSGGGGTTGSTTTTTSSGGGTGGTVNTGGGGNTGGSVNTGGGGNTGGSINTGGGGAGGSADGECTKSGGTVSSGLCCAATGDFPDTCAVGACGCSPDNSHTVKLCQCPQGKCFDGTTCVTQ
jgi:hypothetical protein